MEILKDAISWAHIIGASLSLIFGTIVMFKRKGDDSHKNLGTWYLYAMLINNLTALVILNAFGKWFFPHYLAIACLVTIIPGIIAVKKKFKNWLRIHIASMIFSYYLLIGGTINETFLNIPFLRPYILENAPIIGILHSIAIVIFIGIIIYYLRKYRKNNISLL